MDEARSLSRQSKASLIVSISDPERRPETTKRLSGSRSKVCPLDFHDIERPAPGLTAPEIGHIESALAMLGRTKPDATVIVHCHAGISRSSATAIILVAARQLWAGANVHAAFRHAFAQIQEVAPHARPNMRVMELGSEALRVDPSAVLPLAWNLHRGTS